MLNIAKEYHTQEEKLTLKERLTAKDLVLDRVGPCGFCGGQSGSGTGFSPNCSVFPVSIIPP
jgi:hypothetical protein